MTVQYRITTVRQSRELHELVRTAAYEAKVSENTLWLYWALRFFRVTIDEARGLLTEQQMRSVAQLHFRVYQDELWAAEQRLPALPAPSWGDELKQIPGVWEDAGDRTALGSLAAEPPGDELQAVVGSLRA